jgi:DNA-binding MarR family transcriptional regulator
MTAPETLDYWRHQVWVLLHYAHDIVVKNEEDVFRRKVGVSYQKTLILMVMESFENPVTAVELARVLQRNPNTVSMILDRMEKQSLVKKVRSQIDRRLVHVRMTPTGKEKLAEAIGVSNDLVGRIVTGFSTEELKVFAKFLDKITSQAARETGLKQSPTEFAAENIQRVGHMFNAENQGRPTRR